MPRVSLGWVFLFAALAGYFAFQSRVERHKTDAQATKLDEAEKRWVSEQRHLSTIEKELTQAKERMAAIEAVAKQGAPAKVEPTDSASQMVGLRDIVRDHPEFAALRMQILRREQIHQYGDKLLALHLPPDQLERVKQLLVERTMAQGDAEDVLKAAGATPESPEYTRAVGDARKSVETEIANVIGQDQTKSLLQSGNYRYQVDSIATEMTDAGTPITPIQAAQLSDTISQAVTAVRRNKQAGADSSIAGAPAKTQDQIVIEQAAAYLTPEQLTALQTAQKNSAEQQKMYSAIFKLLPPHSSISDN